MATSTVSFKLGPATREAFGKTLAEIARTNKDIVTIDADLSKSTMTTFFAKEFPDRFFQCGIAESNMVGLAAGLAASGKIPFASSFSCFILNKGFEQLRVGAGFTNWNVKVVGTHSGISIGEDGPSQMSIEDLSLACSLAGFTVLSPADEPSMKAAVRLAASTPGPFFIRAGRVKAPLIYGEDQKFEIGKALQHGEGKDLTIMSTGLLVAESLIAADMLKADGIQARVVDHLTIKPLDREMIAKSARETAKILVAEEHLVDAGLGVRVAQIVTETHPVPMAFVGINNTYAESGLPEEVMQKYGMTASNIYQHAKVLLARK
jgi:transketolase